MVNCHFSGWATRHNLLCGDGRTIRKDAFKDNDGQTVPLIWNHDHTRQDAVLGHALLENRDDGVYAYCTFNQTEAGKHAHDLVRNGDVRSLSIYANKLKQIGNDVIHGSICELSLVLAGANPGAYIDFVMAHGDADGDSVYANYDENALVIYHSDEKPEAETVGEVEQAAEAVDNPTEETEQAAETQTEEAEQPVESNSEETLAHAEEKPEEDESIADVLSTLTDKQMNAVSIMVGELIGNEGDVEETETENNEEDNNMKHNIFENETQENVLAHADIVANAIEDGKRFGSLRESLLQHAAANNITDVKELFPMEKDLNMPPKWIREDAGWVSKIMGAVHHTPFSRVRALFAEMDETEARARGYIKGKEKANLKLAIMKRTTAPTTVYIKMKMDRDDKVDISFDAIPWIRAEARNQLDRELARAFLLGDKRDPGTDDKIDELCIRPVLTDDDMYTIKYTVTDGTDFHNDFNSASENDSEAKGVIRAAVKARKEYKGSGKPTFFTTEDLLTELLLIEDQNGRRIYESETALATAMRVKEIVTIPEMELHTDVYGIIVNMNDYNVGADKGGEVSMFEDFDIDYNQEKFLMETRCSGALVQPKSAIVLKKATAGTNA